MYGYVCLCEYIVDCLQIHKEKKNASEDNMMTGQPMNRNRNVRLFFYIFLRLFPCFLFCFCLQALKLTRYFTDALLNLIKLAVETQTKYSKDRQSDHKQVYFEECMKKKNNNKKRILRKKKIKINILGFLLLPFCTLLGQKV